MKKKGKSHINETCNLICGENEMLPCCSEITAVLSLANIFFKIDQRTKIFLWKGVKCFCSDVQNPSGIVPADFGHPRPICNFFSFSKKVVFGWYTFCQNTNNLDDLKSTKITIVQGDFRITF